MSTVKEEVKEAPEGRDSCLVQFQLSGVPSSFIRNWCPVLHH